MQTKRRVTANPQTKPTDLGCESAKRLAATIRRHLCSSLGLAHDDNEDTDDDSEHLKLK